MPRLEGSSFRPGRGKEQQRESTKNGWGDQLKGHCHGHFAVFWSKLLKYLINSLL